MNDKVDVTIVGAGVVGLAHAWRAAAAGLSVRVIERSKLAEGASIRNFGMIWPIGQTAGEGYDLAIRSRELWIEASQAAGFWLSECGSLHVAHRSDELDVLAEFVDSDFGHNCKTRLLSPPAALEKSAGIRPSGLLGAMWSPTELCVNPAQAMHAIPKWLEDMHHVRFEFGEQAIAANGQGVRTSSGRNFPSERTLVCSGADFETLFPQQLAASGLVKCKLHMLQTLKQPSDWRLGPHLASGLTLRHYQAFRELESLAALKQRVADETPELDLYGIHVMASQNAEGMLTLGDSHEYGSDITPFDSLKIDELILREIGKQFTFPLLELRRRWHGVYAKHPTALMFQTEPTPGVTVCMGPGGAGMTLSMGYADAFWKKSLKETS